MTRFWRSIRAARDAVTANPMQVLLAFLPILICVPWNPASSTVNYEYQLHLAYASGLQYGKDILATYGPLGFLGIPFYHPATFPLLVLFNVVVYVLLVIRLIAVSRALGDDRFGLRACLVFLPAALGYTREWAPVLFVPYLLVLIYCLETILRGWKLGWRTATIYAVVFAAFTLMKLTFTPLVLAAVTLCAISEAWHGSIPKTAPIFAASLAVLWVLSGQSVDNVGAFLASSFQIVAGYKDGMEILDMRIMASAVPLLFAHTVLWLAASAAAWRIGRWAALVISAVLLVVLYAVLLNGHVRQDGEHAMPCILATLSLWALLNPLIKSDSPYRWPWLAAASRLACLSILLCLLVLWLLQGSPPDFRQIVRRPVGLYWLVLKGTGHLKAQALAMDESLRPQAVPGLEGVDVDVPNGDPGIVTVSGATLRLRPTLTSYSAYTPQLARANADFLESVHGPGAILLQHPFATDNKFPTIEDTFSWLSLLSHYRHVRPAGRYELFERRADPIETRIVPLTSRTIALGEDVVVPHDESRAIWVEIAVSPNIVGRLTASAFKPIPVYLTASLEDGTEQGNRLNLRMAKSGFLLSPYLRDVGTLRALSAAGVGGWRPHAVKTIRIDRKVRHRNLNIDIFYKKKVEVRFFALHLGPAPPHREEDVRHGRDDHMNNH